MLYHAFELVLLAGVLGWSVHLTFSRALPLRRGLAALCGWLARRDGPAGLPRLAAGAALRLAPGSAGCASGCGSCDSGRCAPRAASSVTTVPVASIRPLNRVATAPQDPLK